MPWFPPNFPLKSVQFYGTTTKSSLILMKDWIVEDDSTYSHYEEIVNLAREEGMPPKVFCKAMEWLPAFFSSKRTEKVRKL